MQKHFSIFLFFISSTLFAQEIEELISDCSQVSAESERLSCYDDIAESKNLKVEQNLSETGEWIVRTSINPLDDSKTMTLMLKATEGLNDYGEAFWVFIRLKSNETDVFIDWGQYLGSSAFVTTRVDKEEIEKSFWALSTDESICFHPEPIPFIKSLLGKSKLVVQVTPYSSNPSTAIFNISQLDKIIEPLRKEGNW